MIRLRRPNQSARNAFRRVMPVAPRGARVLRFTLARRGRRGVDTLALAAAVAAARDPWRQVCTDAKNDAPRTFSSIRSAPPNDGTARAVQSARSHSRHVIPI